MFGDVMNAFKIIAIAAMMFSIGGCCVVNRLNDAFGYVR